MKPAKMGIRIDSGDVSYLTKQARKMLDEAGLRTARSLYPILWTSILSATSFWRGAQINSSGVGERLITAKSGAGIRRGVLSWRHRKERRADTEDHQIRNVEKITNPGLSRGCRLYSKDTGKARGDVITLAEETIPVQESCRDL